MNVIDLNSLPDNAKGKKIIKRYTALRTLLSELRNKDLPDKITNEINTEIKIINDQTTDNKSMPKEYRRVHKEILALLLKELKWVPKHYYQTIWMSLGMAFAVPLGIVFGSVIGNMGMLGIGIPIGMGLGIALGVSMDKKAYNEGRQLNVESLI